MVAGLFTTCLLSLLLLPIAVLAGPHASSPFLNRHHSLARRAEGNVQLYKRFDGARLTFYNGETGVPGSCGALVKNSDFSVAMNMAMMNKATMCFKSIRIICNGKTVIAFVADSCPGCPADGLDLTPELFNQFASQSVGVLYCSWEFVVGGAPAPAPSSPAYSPPPAPTHTQAPPPAPTISIPPISVSLWSSSQSKTFTYSSASHTNTHNSTVAPTSSSSAATPSVTINLSSGPASGLAEPTGTAVVTPGSVNNIQSLFKAFIALDALISVAHSN